MKQFNDLLPTLTKACGNSLLAFRPVSTHPDDARLLIVLRNIGDDARDPYVTHILNLENMGYVCGHYFSDPDKAMDDFKTR